MAVALESTRPFDASEDGGLRRTLVKLGISGAGALLCVALFAAQPAMAEGEGTLSVSPSSGPSGTTITTSGTVDPTCDHDSPIVIEIGEPYGTNQAVDGSTSASQLGTTTAAGGTFSVTGTIPESIGTPAPGGTATIAAGAQEVHAYCFALGVSNSPILSASATFTIGTDGPVSTTTPATTTAPSAPTAEVTLSTGSVTVGGQIEVSGVGFAAGSTVTVELHSDPIRLATLRADDAGSVAATVTIPADVVPGEHSIVLVGVAADGSELRVDAPLTLLAAAPPAAPLAASPSYTG